MSLYCGALFDESNGLVVNHTVHYAFRVQELPINEYIEEERKGEATKLVSSESYKPVHLLLPLTDHILINFFLGLIFKTLDHRSFNLESAFVLLHGAK